MNTNQEESSSTGQFDGVEYYEGMEYVCEDCGRVEHFDGIAVAVRSPFRDGADCSICRMELADAEKYWDGDREPVEVRTYV